jgi:hypothetical protein
MRGIFTKIAVAVAVGFLGAYPFASASGLVTGDRFNGTPDELFVFCGGIILFFLTLGLIGPAGRLIERVVDALVRTEVRPAPMNILGMFCSGTVCAIAAMVIQYNAMHSNPGGVTITGGGFGRGSGAGVVMHSSGSLVLGILTVLTFLLGASLIGLGVWASLTPAPRTTSATTKPAVPELDEVSA